MGLLRIQEGLLLRFESMVRSAGTRSTAVLIAAKMYCDWQSSRRLAAGNFLSSNGTRLAKLSIEESLEAIALVFDYYVTYSGLSADSLKGKRVLEVGPGDNLGVALRLCAAGAEEVVCLDRFYQQRDKEKQRQIYRTLRRTLTESEMVGFDAVVKLDAAVDFSSQRLRHVYGTPLEEAEKALGSAQFDLIVSHAVLEHVYDPDAAFAAMDRLLVPGGRMVHWVDFRDHGMFSHYGHHPLTFLTVPCPLFRRMTEHRGDTNRRLIDYYQRKMAELGYESEMLVTDVLGIATPLSPPKAHIALGVDYDEFTVSLIHDIRDRLQPQFKSMSDQQLAVAAALLAARKP